MLGQIPSSIRLVPATKNTWLSLHFSPRRPGSPRATFSSHMAMTSIGSREASSRRLRSVSDAPSRTTARLRSTKLGTFGNQLIVTCENGLVFTIDGIGTVTPIAPPPPGAHELKDQL